MINTDIEPCFIIAEVGVNHNGDLGSARELIDVAVDAGADAVKFQSFTTDKLVTKDAKKAEYQKQYDNGSDTQAGMLRGLELSRKDTLDLKQYCDNAGIEFMSTPFDSEMLRFLVEDVKLNRIKLPSGEAINGPLLLAASRTSLPVILSTGMCTMEEVHESLATLAWGIENATGIPSGREELRQLMGCTDWTNVLRDRVHVLHCVTEYPAAPGLTNLRSMDFISDQTSLPVGLSDHSIGKHITIAAVARGARIIEKHFTLSRSLPGPDHLASLEPIELKEMVKEIREIEVAMGDYSKQPQSIEFTNRQAARGSLSAASPISTGCKFTIDNLTIKRPGTGVSPLEYWDYIDIISQRDYQKDDLID